VDAVQRAEAIRRLMPEELLAFYHQTGFDPS
jgi:hypothetical protein